MRFRSAISIVVVAVVMLTAWAVGQRFTKWLVDVDPGTPEVELVPHSKAVPDIADSAVWYLEADGTWTCYSDPRSICDKANPPTSLPTRQTQG